MKDFSEVRERVEKLNIIDDTLFQKMAEDIGFCEEMISAVMDELQSQGRASKKSLI